MMICARHKVADCDNCKHRGYAPVPASDIPEAPPKA